MSNPTPTVSVIIPSFNTAWVIPSLVKCLKAVSNNTTEIIFVDDGSSDGSADLFREQMPNALVLQQEKAGVGAARNRGAEAAGAEFLQFLDADDTIEPQKIETQIQSARAESLDVVYSDWRMVIVSAGEAKPEPWKPREAPGELIESLLDGGWWFPTVASLIRRTALFAVGGWNAFLHNTCDDFDLWARLAIDGYRFGYVRGNFASYFRYLSARSLSRANQEQSLSGEATIIRDAVQRLHDRGKATPARLRAAAQRLYHVARNTYTIDPDWHKDLLEEVRQIDPAFRPHGSRLHRIACRTLGYTWAERLTSIKRFVRQPMAH
jgi:glycosyltransferase involved in cell wall biosynthesis